jgi:hypothetical protein
MLQLQAQRDSVSDQNFLLLRVFLKTTLTSLFLRLQIKGFIMGTTIVYKTEEIFPLSIFMYINAHELKNIETAIMWELKVLQALDLPSVDLI